MSCCAHGRVDDDFAGGHGWNRSLIGTEKGVLCSLLTRSKPLELRGRDLADAKSIKESSEKDFIQNSQVEKDKWRIHSEPYLNNINNMILLVVSVLKKLGGKSSSKF